MTARWEAVALADVCQIKPPKSEARSRLTEADLVSFLPMEDLDTDRKLVTPTHSRTLSEVAGSYTYFANGDVLLAKITPCFENGKLGIATGLKNGVGFGSSEYVVLRPREKLSNEWLYYFLSRKAFRSDGAEQMAGAVGHKRLTAAFIESTVVPLPVLSEQQRIVEILDEAFDGIATTRACVEKSLQHARAVYQGYLEAIFGEGRQQWIDSTIGQHVRFIDYRGRTPRKLDSGLRLITAKNVKMGYLQHSPAEYVAEDSYDDWMTRGIPRCGDVLFTTEAPLANVAQLDTDEKVVFAQRIIIMQPDASKLDSTFLKYLLLSRPVQRRIHAKGTGATAKGIKASLLKTIEIAFPRTIAEQRKIAARLDALRLEVERLESIYQQKLTALDQLKQSLLHHAFAAAL